MEGSSGRPAAVLWDMDGTLMDPNGSIRVAIDGAVAWGGFAPFHPDEVLVGKPLREILHLRTQDPELVEGMVDEFRRISYEETWKLAAWHEGVKEAVEAVRAAGIPTAIVTTKGQMEADLLLEKRGEAHLFDAVVGDDDTRPVKPDPAPVLEACRRLGVDPRAQSVWMVGDTVYDVRAGRAAGCRTLGVTWGHGTGAHGVQEADVIVDDARALRATLLNA